MNIAVFGLGYVGCVTAACLAQLGHTVLGVDTQEAKVKQIQSGFAPIVEPNLQELIKNGRERKLLSATTDAASAISQADVVLICVGTPSAPNGDLDLSYVERVCHSVGEHIANKNSYTAVVIRSTILPGKSDSRLIPIIEEASGKPVGSNWGFGINPEFLREGSAVKDFQNPPYTIIGQSDEQTGEILAQLYSTLDAPIFRIPLGEAEMVKYTSNAFHALKVVFANEIGNLCQAYGIDSHNVMDLFTQDAKLNLSAAYLKPGSAFGGSCLGKDMRALLYTARQQDLKLPVLESILPSNQLQIEKALSLILNEGERDVGLIGLSFKSQTDDLRESPSVILAERLIGKGFNLNIYDQEVSMSRLHGSNLSFIENVIPHLSSYIRPDIEEAVNASKTVVITKKLTSTEQHKLTNLLQPEHTVVDLVRLNGSILKTFEGEYRGICW